MTKLKIDIHVHTNYSDSISSVKDVIEAAKRRGLDGLAITDHHTIEGAKKAMAKGKGLIIVPGEEIETRQGDILALGIRKTILKGLSIVEAIKQIHIQHGLTILPHPTIPFFSKLRKSDLRRLAIDGLEVFSAITPLTRHYASKNEKIARKLGLPRLAGSDSHFPETVGDAYTILDVESCNLQGILDAIRLGRTEIGCQASRLIYKIKMFRHLGLYFIDRLGQKQKDYKFK